MILQYYLSGQEDRQREYDDCLQKNLDNPLISLVHILTEESLDLSYFRHAEKLVQTVIGERLTYEEAFNYANEFTTEEHNIWILANADIYFDESLQYLSDVDMNARMLALSRHDIQKDGSLRTLPPAYALGSQDAWIFIPPVPTEKMMTHFFLGIPKCDSRIAYEFMHIGYHVINPSKKIIVRHLDLTREINTIARSTVYSEMISEENMHKGKAVRPPYHYIYPTASLKGVQLWELAAIYVGLAMQLIRRTLSGLIKLS